MLVTDVERVALGSCIFYFYGNQELIHDVWRILCILCLHVFTRVCIEYKINVLQNSASYELTIRYNILCRDIKYNNVVIVVCKRANCIACSPQCTSV